MVRTEPYPWSRSGRTECSILEEIETVQSLGQAILRGESVCTDALSEFATRFEASVRCAFWHLDDLGWGERAEVEPGSPPIDEGDLEREAPMEWEDQLEREW
jgi:hypothetical protein